MIGLSDGLTVPFALAAGLSSLGESNLVVLGGIAELIAGAISMGIGGFLASQAERDHYRYLRNHTAQRVIRSCAGEMEREVSEVLSPVGVDDKTCRAVARCLRDVEVDTQGNGTLSTGGGGTDPENVGLKWSEDVGLTAFLLKFGQGLGVYIFVHSFEHFLTHFVCRGNSRSSYVCFRIHHRHGIFDWWFNSSPALLLHPPRPNRPHILLYRNWNCFTCFRRRQGTRHWCQPKSSWLCLGRFQHPHGGWYRSCCCVCYC